MTKPSVLNRRLAKWEILLSKYEMQFLPQKAIKRQVLADFLVRNPASEVSKLYEDLSDEVNDVITRRVAPDSQIWQFYFEEPLGWALTGRS